MANALTNKLVEQINAKIPDEMQDSVDRFVTAGMQVMHGEKTHAMMLNQLNKDGDPLENAGEGVAKLVGMLWKDAAGNIPMQAAVQAGTILMCNALEFMQDAGMITIDNQTLAFGIQAYTSSLLQLMGGTPDKWGELQQKAQSEQQMNALPPEQADGIIREVVGAEEEQAAPEGGGIVSQAKGA